MQAAKFNRVKLQIDLHNCDEQYKQRCNKLSGEPDKKGLLDEAKDLIDMAIAKIRKKQQGGSGDPPEIDEIKKLLKKIKGLIPGSWGFMWLWNLLDKILDNLCPASGNEEELERLQALKDFINDYRGALGEGLKSWHADSRIKCYEDAARDYLDQLAKEHLQRLKQDLEEGNSF